MKWPDCKWSKRLMTSLRDLWNTSEHFVPNNPDADKAEFMELIADLESMEVPAGCNPAHEEYLKGAGTASKLIAYLESCQLETTNTKHEQCKKRRDPPHAQAKAKQEHDPSLAQANKKAKKERQKNNSDGLTPETKRINYRNFVSRPDNKLHEYQTKLLNSDGSQAFQQLGVYFGDYFWEQVGDTLPPGTLDEMEKIYVRIAADFMKIFRHAPPLDLILADFNSRPNEGIKAIWREWCNRTDTPYPEKVPRKKPVGGFREFAFAMWTAAFEAAKELGSNAETAAAAGAKAAAFAQGDVSTDLRGLFHDKKNGVAVWQPQVQATAAEFAKIAVAEFAAADAVAGIGIGSADSKGEGADAGSQEVADLADAATDVATRLNDSSPVLIDGAGAGVGPPQPLPLPASAEFAAAAAAAAVTGIAAAAAVAGIGGELGGGAGGGAGSGSAGGGTANRLMDSATDVIDGQAPGEL